MRKFLTNILKEKYLFLIGLVASGTLLWPLFFAPYFSHHDDVQVIRLHQMNECIKDLQIPCRWVPDLGGEYGYPLFNYYAPLPYYFGEIVYLIIGNFIISAKIMFVVSFLGSYLFMYLLARKFWGEAGGVISAVYYTFAPYHAVDFYVRGAMGEMWALMFFPAIFWAILRLKEKLNVRSMGLVALTLSGLIMSHNISALIFVPFTVLFIITLLFVNWNHKFLSLFVIALFMALLISAFYWMPAMIEKNLVHVETTTVGYFSYTEHFKGLRKLLIDRAWSWGPSLREIPGGEKDAMSYQIGWAHLLGWLVSIYVAKRLFKKNTLSFWIIVFSGVIIIVSIFMIHPRSVYVWHFIEPLKYLQFPWRFLAFVIFFISLLAGSGFSLLRGNKYTLLGFALALLLVFVLNFTYFRPEKFVYLSDSEYLSGTNWDRQIKRSIFDYLPIYAKFPPAELATISYEVLKGSPKITNYMEGSDNFRFELESGEEVILKMSKYYFPNWKIFANGKEIPISYDNEMGLITFELSEGKYKIEGRLFNSPVRTLSNLLSILGLASLGFVIYSSKK